MRVYEICWYMHELIQRHQCSEHMNGPACAQVYKDAETWNPAALRSAARGWRANGVSVPHVPLTAALTDDSTEYSNLEKANSGRRDHVCGACLTTLL
eukprot:SAG31_NODE_734_length_12489_cov_6.922034_11_plen_97_part_00